jgi:predicted O-methyltransferase YrrM
MDFKSLALRVTAPVIDFLLLPFIALASVPFRLFRRFGAHRLPVARTLFRRLGFWPLRRHYYDPLFDPRDLSRPIGAPRSLPGISWNLPAQLAVLRQMNFAPELSEFLQPPADGGLRFHYDNQSFLSGDADFLYSFVRLYKPRRVIEVGCGNSTLIIAAANRVNRRESPQHNCEHLCIEPYEHPWLERLPVTVLRQRVEHLDASAISALGAGDLLFIDSSHIIRPQGDVVCEILELLPRLSPGVVVHFHDIFSPRDYLPDWIEQRAYLWNEQYLLEAYLSENSCYELFAALNLLHHDHYDELARICARHARTFEPGSFYIRRTRNGVSGELSSP